MASFDDLPKDVVWLIFRICVGKRILSDYYIFEKGCDEATDFGGASGHQMRDLSLISKRYLKIVQSKCFKFERGWLFIKGALTN